MSINDNGIQAWISAEQLALLLGDTRLTLREGESGTLVDLAVLAGRVLRARATLAGLAREVRLAVPRLLDTAERFDALVEAAWSDAEAADSLCEVLAEAIDEDTAMALVDLRDDLESLRRAVTVALVAEPEDAPPVAEATRATLAQLAGRIDRAAEPLLTSLVAWSAGAGEPRPWMLECLDAPNPWWLDLVDPVMRAARALARRAPRRRPMGERFFTASVGRASDATAVAMAVTAVDDNAVEIKVRPADDGFHVTLVHPPVDADVGRGFTLVWETAEAPATLTFSHDADLDLYEAQAPASLGLAVAMILVQDDRVWELVARPSRA
ncbi:MAG: hypothetical protein U0326_34950 [Polyangiales bacterium]